MLPAIIQGESSVTFFNFRTPLALGPAVLAAGLATPAMSLTADELWTQWQDYFGGLGYEMTAEVTETADGLSIANLSWEVPLAGPAAGAGQMRMSVGSMTLVNGPGGVVSIEMPDVMPITMDVDAPDEDPVRIALEQRSQGLEITASGDPADTEYTYAADSLTLALTEIAQMNESVEFGSAEMALGAISGTSSIQIGDAYVVDQTIMAETMSYVVDIRNPEGEGSFEMTGELAGLELSGGGTVPKGVDMTNMSEVLNAGYDVAANASYASGQSALAFREGNEFLDMTSSSEGGAFEFSMNLDRFLYAVSSRAVRLAMSGAQMPFPIDIAADEIGMRLATPLVPTEENKEFGLGVTLAGVALPEDIWRMGDPGGQLPHDPLTVQIDLTGQGRLFVDLTNPEEMEQLGKTGGVPGQVESLALNTLRVKGAGAEITGDADLDVDNEAMSPLGPFPNVFGTANLRVTGVNALLQTLTQMGLVPQGQAMMISGMISQLGKPETGPDDLSAEIVLSEEGALTVNGNPIPLQ